MIEKIILDDWFDISDSFEERKKNESRLEELLLNNNAIFTISRSNMIRSVKVNSVKTIWTDRGFRVFINEYPVDNEKPIKIDIPDNLPDYILGIPSGEVIFTNKENIEKLKLLRYVKYQDIYAYKDLYVKNVNIFRDADLNEILGVLHNSPDEEDGFGDGPLDDIYHIKNLFG